MRVGLTELGSKVEFWAAAKLRRSEVKRKVKESMLNLVAALLNFAIELNCIEVDGDEQRRIV